MLRNLSFWSAGTGGAVVKGASTVGAAVAAVALAPAAGSFVAVAAAFAIGSATINSLVDVLGSRSDAYSEFREEIRQEFASVRLKIEELTRVLHFVRDIILYSILYVIASDILPIIISTGLWLIWFLSIGLVFALFVLGFVVIENRYRKWQGR